MEWELLYEEYIYGLLFGYCVVYRWNEIGYIWNIIVVGFDENGIIMKGFKKYGVYVVKVGVFIRKGGGKLIKGFYFRIDEDGKWVKNYLSKIILRSYWV